MFHSKWPFGTEKAVFHLSDSLIPTRQNFDFRSNLEKIFDLEIYAKMVEGFGRG